MTRAGFSKSLTCSAAGERKGPMENNPLRPELTAERIYIEFTAHYGEEMIRRHIRRYEWSLSHVRESDVLLDAGCGSGYGSRILRNHCREVVGIDIGSEAIAYARARLAESPVAGLHFAQCNLAEVGEADLRHAVFDTVVSVEVIEHLAEEDQHRFLRGVVRRLAPGGQLLITTPLRGELPLTEYHVREFTDMEFREFLGTYFTEVSFDRPADFGITPTHFQLAKCAHPRP